LTSFKSGLPPGGVDVLPQSLPDGSPLDVVETHAEFSIAGGFGGKELATWTANVKLAELPAATVPTARAHELPALLPGVQVHPGDEEAGRKVVSCGTVSARLTPAAPWVPRFDT
jgi:hypothetical protein